MMISRIAVFEIIVGLALLVTGYYLERSAPASWPMGWAHAIVMQVVGASCFYDGIIRPHAPPSRLMIAGLAIAYALLLSVH